VSNNPNTNSRNNRAKPVANGGYIINEYIRAESLRVINHEGENLGVISRRDAQALATSVGLDLVQISESETGVTAKIMNFGKFLYEKKKQQGEAKKHQKVIQVKELKMRPHIGEGDYNIRINQAEQFLKEGKRVKFTLQFRGREVLTMEDAGSKLFLRIMVDLNTRQLGTILEEKESRGTPFWSKIVYLKEK
jgi:translation initiation factor IF-3